MIVGAVGRCDLCVSGSGGMQLLKSGMIGLSEFVSQSKSVYISGNDQTDMAIVSTSVDRMNRLCIVVKFFLEFANGGGNMFDRYGS